MGWPLFLYSLSHRFEFAQTAIFINIDENYRDHPPDAGIVASDPVMPMKGATATGRKFPGENRDEGEGNAFPGTGFA